MKTPELKFFLLDTGYCTASEHHLITGGPRRQIECHSLAALIHHPNHGWVLWDTGYAPRLLEETRAWPYWLYRLATPLHIDPRKSVKSQILSAGIKPSEIKTILISHFHADHISGIMDFPEARIICDRSAHDDVANRTGLDALSRAFIPSLLPVNFKEQIELIGDYSGPDLLTPAGSFNLFGDDSLQIVPLPGHARGQIGLLANTTHGKIFMAADSVWTSRSFRERRPPSSLTNLIVDNKKDVMETINHLGEFWARNPEIRIIPTHCPEAFQWTKRFQPVESQITQPTPNPS